MAIFHNRVSYRLRGWGYGNQAFYFVTAVTKNREHSFGKISNGIMTLTELGKQLELQLKETPSIRPDMNITVDVFAVMPDHFHAIIGIGANPYNKTSKWITPSFSPPIKNLGSIMRGIKSSVTTYARKNDIPFEWQRLYHDRVIRNDNEYYRIRKYIIDNVKNWKGQKTTTLTK